MLEIAGRQIRNFYLRTRRAQAFREKSRFA
jgi:hypothetical protein